MNHGDVRITVDALLLAANGPRWPGWDSGSPTNVDIAIGVTAAVTDTNVGAATGGARGSERCC